MLWLRRSLFSGTVGNRTATGGSRPRDKTRSRVQDRIACFMACRDARRILLRSISSAETTPTPTDKAFFVDEGEGLFAPVLRHPWNPGLPPTTRPQAG